MVFVSRIGNPSTDQVYTQRVLPVNRVNMNTGYSDIKNLDNELMFSNDLERSPDDDEFVGRECNQLMSFATPTVGKAKMPSSGEVVATIIMIKEVFNVLNDALKSGRNLYESIAEWINSNKNMSDTEKVKALQLGSALAKEMSSENIIQN
mgnify:CR=1 FL=1